MIASPVFFHRKLRGMPYRIRCDGHNINVGVTGMRKDEGWFVDDEDDDQDMEPDWDEHRDSLRDQREPWD